MHWHLFIWFLGRLTVKSIVDTETHRRVKENTTNNYAGIGA